MFDVDTYYFNRITGGLLLILDIKMSTYSDVEYLVSVHPDEHEIVLYLHELIGYEKIGTILDNPVDLSLKIGKLSAVPGMVTTTSTLH